MRDCLSSLTPEQDAAKLKAQLVALEAELGPPPIESDVNIQ